MNRLDAATVDLLPDAVIEVNAARRIDTVNSSAVRLTGYPMQALIGASCADLLGVRDAAGRPLWDTGWPPALRLRGTRALAQQDIVLRRADGQDVRVSLTGSCRRSPQGQLEGVVLVLRDTTRREWAGAAGIEIVSIVSHELRSPLASVKGYTRLLLNRWGQLTDEQKQLMLGQVNHDADRVSRLVGELLDVSRLESGRMVLRRQTVDLDRLARLVIEKLRFSYPELEITRDFPDEYPEAWADADKVEQVLTNLVENACKYASPQGMVVHGAFTDGEVSLAVADRGDGIPAEDLRRIFTKFFRRAESRPTGSGLGLWISRGLVEAHGGRLLATSHPGEGTTFRFSLPRADRWAEAWHDPGRPIKLDEPERHETRTSMKQENQ
jgi:PAS domain S-box-containing protein